MKLTEEIKVKIKNAKSEEEKKDHHYHSTHIKAGAEVWN